MIGRVIKGKYRILEEIGSGTLATVYVARDLQTNRFLALKIIRLELAHEQDFARRFRREARLLTQLDSPHAVRLLDFGTDEGVDFIALEYVEGRSLKAILDHEAPLDVERALGLARQIAHCLADASTVGLVHRDLRPANIMVSSGDTVKVMDFGVAAGADLSRLSSSGLAGVPYYLAPELAEGKIADSRADVYSLGVVLFEMLTGKVPYPGDNAASVVLKHLHDSIPSARQLNADISPELDALITKCLAKDPRDRYQPIQLVSAINDLLGDVDTSPGIEGDLAGHTLGRYQLTERIGRGGMATVYKAYQPGLDRYVAVKVLPTYLSHDPRFAARFQREARAIASLDHPNILPVYDSGREGDLTYIVMRYVQAGTLKDLLGQPVPLDQTVEIISQVAAALDDAHNRGIIHRDVKPSNVLMAKPNWALLSDFGLARMVEASTQITKTGASVGTPAYMSPEQGQGRTVDARSDVYSLGVVLYEMLTGRVPYDAETPMAIVIKHITAPLPRPSEFNPDIPEPVERVILKALAKEPVDRFQGAGELAVALRKAVEAAQTAPVPPPVPPPEETRHDLPIVTVPVMAAPKPRRPWLGPGIGALVLLLVGIFGLGYLWLSRLDLIGAVPSPTGQVALVELTVTPTSILTPTPATATDTPLPATLADTSTPVPPTPKPVVFTRTPTATLPRPTATRTFTPVPPTRTSTQTPVPPTSTRTFTAVLPTPTRTASYTPTPTPVPPTSTPTPTPTDTLVPPTTTDTPAPTSTDTWTTTSTATPDLNATATAKSELLSTMIAYMLTRQATSTPTVMSTPAPTDTSPPMPMPTSLSTPTTPTLTPAPGADAVVAVQDLILWSGPGSDSQKVNRYPEGTSLRVLGKDPKGEWLKVQTPDGQQGWMFASLVHLNFPLSTVAVVPFITPVVPPKPSPTTPTLTPAPWADAVVAVQDLILWSGPGSDSQKVNRYPEGASLRVLGKDPKGEWLKVQTPDGQQGWMFTALVHLNTLLSAVAVPAEMTCKDDAAFVADVTVPDNTTFKPGERFEKTWRVRNSGTCPWGSGYGLALVSGDRMNAAEDQGVGSVAPGKTADLSIAMVGPDTPGTYTNAWQMMNPQGEPFGGKLTVVIQVPFLNPALGNTWTRPADGMPMAYVPAGEFQMGSDETYEQPIHPVALNGFWLDHTEVTNAQYHRCVATGTCAPSGRQGDPDFGGDLQPVVKVSWEDAAAYCKWAGARLPTEAEWEYAARGPQNRVYPWGDAFVGKRLNYCDARCAFDWAATTVDDGYPQTAPVGSYPGGESWCGALDLAGNVLEWVADWFGSYPVGRQVNPTGPPSGVNRVMRGGSWVNTEYDTRSARRPRDALFYRADHVGFRCAKVAPEISLPTRAVTPTQVSVLPTPTRLPTPAPISAPRITVENVGQVGPVRTLQGHAGPVWSVAFAPDGQTLASGSADKAIMLWRVGDGAVLRTLTGHTEAVDSVAFAPDGQTLVSGSSDKTVRLWQVSNGKLLGTLTGHSDTVMSVAISPDGGTVASGSSDSTVRLWQVSDGTLLRTLENRGKVEGVALAPDGGTLAAATWGWRVWLWNVGNGALLRMLRGPEGGFCSPIVGECAVHCVAFAPDGQALATGASGGRPLVLWRTNDGTVIHTFGDYDGQVQSVAYSPDGQIVASGGADTTLRLWRASDGAPLAVLYGHTDGLFSVAFSPDGGWVASASRDGTVRLWGLPGATTTESETPACTDGAAFVADVTVPDNTIFKPGEVFDKTWRVRNSGTCPWDSGYRLAFVSGDRMKAGESQAIAPTAPGETTDLTVKMTVPNTPGTYTGVWQMINAEDQPFGRKLTVVIQVPSPGIEIKTSTRPTDGMEMVYVPAGEFPMGSNKGSPDELPVHTVALDAFWMDRTEVTNAQYRHCTAVGACTASIYDQYANYSKDNQPVVGMSWHSAAAYCQWAAARLPTEAEWEYAARGPDGRVYPWGNTWDASKVNSWESGPHVTSLVGTYPGGASWCGALDLAGNVWEWVADWYSGYPSERQTNPTGPSSGQLKVLRGGSWQNDPIYVRGASRFGNDPNSMSRYFGLRCASRTQ